MLVYQAVRFSNSRFQLELGMKFPRTFLFFMATLLWTPAFVAAQQPTLKSTPAIALAKPDARDRLIVDSVIKLIEEAHFTRRKLDNEISTRMHKMFVEQWDPRKLFFLESDIAEFAAYENKHIQMLMANNLSFPVLVYERFLERVVERNEWAQKLADEKFDFAKDDTVILDNRSTKYAKTADEAKARWRSWIKYELEGMIVDGVKEDEARSRIQKRYRSLVRITKQFDKDELLERYLTAMTGSFDPHSSYMSPRTMEEFDIAMRLQLQGIGALLASEDGKTIVKEVIAGGAADQDKRIKIGDQITGVGEGDNGELIDVVEMSLNNVVRLIRGEAGTRVKLEIVPAKSEQRMVYVLTRKKIELTERGAKGEIIEVPAAGSNPKMQVGVIKLPSFYGGSGAPHTGATADVHRILDDFKKKGVDAVVVDLRNNGGGLLLEAIGLASLFVDDGPIVQVKDFKGAVRQHNDDFPGVAYDGPLVVLINRLSASASEIFAGVIKDYKRGLIVGDSSTFGKGTVAQVLDLSRMMQTDPPVGDGKYGALKITLQAFYRVNGESTQKRGVASDVVLPSPTDNEEFSEAKLDHVLDLDKIASSKFASANLVTPEIAQKVRTESEERRGKSEEFGKLEKRVARLRELIARKSVTFNEAKLKQLKAERKELAEFDLGDDTAKTDPEEKTAPKRFGETVYEREVLGITADLSRLTKQR
jgi:carboxyl-terminal processing protease